MIRSANAKRARRNRAEDARRTGMLLAIHPDLAPQVARLGRLTMATAKVERVQGLRRSNASQPHRNRKKYTRTVKHKKGGQS